MQSYIDFAKKNGVALLDRGSCQFCGAATKHGVHECLEIFNIGFQVLDLSARQNHFYRFLIVDAHALQHPEIHGRWSNHFHLSRLHLIFTFNVQWTYQLSPQLSSYLNTYKTQKSDEYLTPPKVMQRGNITTTDIREESNNEKECKALIICWAKEVYRVWEESHQVVDVIAKGFLGGR